MRNPPRLRTQCPECGKALRLGLSFRHGVGPSQAVRWTRFLAVLLGLATFVYAILFGHDSLGGYGAASACIAGLLVWAVVNQVAARFRGVRLMHCEACRWRREIPAA